MSANALRSSRREFLSAASVAPLLSAGLAGESIAPPAPVVDAGAAQVDYVYFQLWESEVHGNSSHDTSFDPENPVYVVGSIHGTRGEAIGRYREHDVHRERFKPQSAARRYRVEVQDWSPKYPDRREGETSDDQHARYEAAIDAHPQPRHPLDIPNPISVGGCDPFFYDGDELLDRETALAACAEANAGFFPLNPEDRRLLDWRIVLELGESVDTVQFNVEVSESGVGHEERTIHYPIRVVRPTAAEIARYAGVKGGAA